MIPGHEKRVMSFPNRDHHTCRICTQGIATVTCESESSQLVEWCCWSGQLSWIPCAITERRSYGKTRVYCFIFGINHQVLRQNSTCYIEMCGWDFDKIGSNGNENDIVNIECLWSTHRVRIWWVVQWVATSVNPRRSPSTTSSFSPLPLFPPQCQLHRCHHKFWYHHLHFCFLLPLHLPLLSSTSTSLYLYLSVSSSR